MPSEQHCHPSRPNGRRFSNATWVLSLGLVFHLVYIMSVFDCYFTSPVVHGMQQFRTSTPLAKRLVLIVGDGLRADLLYNVNPFPSIPGSPEIVAPYLRSIMEKRGAFGVSHTRVPTESRPGHVAIIGGMYEDVSAVTKGWKANPVDFDSVFNQSSTTFSFGSPDILPMFTRGAVPGRVKEWCYDEEEEDFTKDATALDIWVLDRLKDLLGNATRDTQLDKDLRGDQVVFFLHLLGLDTTGHSYRPHSKEYMKNIQVVDGIVQQTEALLRDFYQDNETAFVFTADHGMSNIGNHGDGNPDSTRTPLVVWGKGARGPREDRVPSSHDAYSRPWGLDKLLRVDVEQADIASLMATLLGINFPVNSVGVLPDAAPESVGFLEPLDEGQTKAEAAFVNAQSILEQYRLKHRSKAARSVFYTPFGSLASEAGLPGHEQTRIVEEHLARQDWTAARARAAGLIKLSLEGLRYLQTYDRFMLRIIVAAGYIGWAGYSATSLFTSHSSGGPTASSTASILITFTAVSVLVAFWSLFTVQKDPITFYIYIAFPCYFWHEILQTLRKSADNSPFARGSTKGAMKFGFAIMVAVGVLQAMVWAYTYRFIWSAGFMVIGSIWPLFSWPRTEKMRQRNWPLFARWAGCCLVTGLFPLRNVEQQEDLTTILTGGLAMVLLANVGSNRLENIEGFGAQHSRRQFRDQLLLMAISMLVTCDSVVRLQAKKGLPLRNQVMGWLIFGISALYPSITNFRQNSHYTKLLILFMAFAPCFIILSICAEGLFYASYCTTLVTWIDVESFVRSAEQRRKAPKSSSDGYEISPDDLRIALFFLFFVQVAFFGTGNVASVSSFYLEPVYRLVPVFNPFVMAALLIFKIIAPYVFLAAVFAILNARLNLPPFSLFLVALSLTDVMTLSFFFNVTDTGSWLEIGQSISFFVITSLLLVWSAGICVLGEWLIALPRMTVNGKPLKST